MKNLSSKLITVFGALLILASAIAIVYPFYFNQHLASAKVKLLNTKPSKTVTLSPPIISSNSYTSTLTHQLPASPSLSCSATESPRIVIPSLSLVAPIEEGVSPSVLDTAVGHVESTVWPLKGVGYSIFAAHDVSYFANIDQLRPGDKILYSTGCSVATYVVTDQFVAHPNDPIKVPQNEPGIVLDTCYPTNALWYTNQRYLVVAKYQGVSYDLNGKLTPYSSLAPLDLSVSIPSSLPLSSLSLANNTQEMGNLTYAGDPSFSFQESINPMSAEEAALENYFAAIHILEQNSPTLWGQLTSVPYPNVLASNPHSFSPLEVLENVSQNNLNSVTLTTEIGAYKVSIIQSVNANTLSITNIEIG